MIANFKVRQKLQPSPESEVPMQTYTVTETQRKEQNIPDLTNGVTPETKTVTTSLTTTTISSDLPNDEIEEVTVGKREPGDSITLTQSTISTSWDRKEAEMEEKTTEGMRLVLYVYIYVHELYILIQCVR